MKQIAEEKGIPENLVLDTMQLALAAAYKKDFGEKGQDIRAKLDPSTGEAKFWQVKTVVEDADEEGYVGGNVEFLRSKLEPHEEVDQRIKFNPEKHILFADAKKFKKNIAIGEELIINLESKTDFGRIAAQTAKQVVIQRLREMERNAILAEFKGREGEVISGTVQRIEGRMIYIDLGRTNGLLPPNEQIPTEPYRIGSRLRCYIVRVEETHRGPAIILSRSHPRLILSLFKFEVPELESGSVEVRAIAREAGSRTKIAVSSNEDSVDPIGSLVGQKGVRVQTVINELGGEKIDIIEWSDVAEQYIAHALAPAKILSVQVMDDSPAGGEKSALVEVAEDQYSLAIGKRGQNVHLAAKLTGWHIDIRGPKGAPVPAAEPIAEEAPAIQTLDAPEEVA